MNSSPEASHTQYKNKWDFSINTKNVIATVATRPKTHRSHSFIGLIVFTTACYFHFKRIFLLGSNS